MGDEGITSEREMGDEGSGGRGVGRGVGVQVLSAGRGVGRLRWIRIRRQGGIRGGSSVDAIHSSSSSSRSAATCSRWSITGGGG